MRFVCVDTFEQWRDESRQLLSLEVPPADVHWTSQPQQQSLFGHDSRAERSPKPVNVPSKFLSLAQQVACHRDSGRWELLYRVLWRLTHEQRNLLEIVSDDDVCRLSRMQKAVSRDVHKMKAFVRFRRVVDQAGKERFIAWHRPDHRIVRIAAPFFARRFKGMTWSILTPDESVMWDQQQLSYGDGVPASAAPNGDELEELWRTYYASIFNPARVKVAMMKSEMPVRHWPTLPEAQLIPELLGKAAGRVDQMIANSEGFEQTATHFLPDKIDLPSLRKSAETCKACDLHQCATQVVFGVGSTNAETVLVGEQPGDAEDIAGEPFVGPAGQLLREVLASARIDPKQLYVTNVVKHFKFTEQATTTDGLRGKRRLHQKPDAREIYACRPWLEAELSVIRPRSIVCLGATAAQALLGRDFRITKQRGQVFQSDWSDRTIATWHPAAILRMPNEQRRREMVAQLTSDLTLATQSQ